MNCKDVNFYAEIKQIAGTARLCQGVPKTVPFATTCNISQQHDGVAQGVEDGERQDAGVPWRMTGRGGMRRGMEWAAGMQ